MYARRNGLTFREQVYAPLYSVQSEAGFLSLLATLWIPLGIYNIYISVLDDVTKLVEKKVTLVFFSSGSSGVP